MFLKNPYRQVLLCLLVLINVSAKAQFSPSSQARSDYLDWLKYQKTKSEGGNLLKWWREESTIGISYPVATTYTSRMHYLDTVYFHSQSTFDSTITGRPKLGFGLHANGNNAYLLTRPGPSSMVSFSVGLQLDFMLWKIETFDGNTLKSSDGNDLVLVNVGLPLTIDYKTGCDVDFDPELKSCFAVGAGVIPTASCNYYNSQSINWRLRLKPYVYASFGFYAWGCWKIRASFTPGKFVVFDQEHEHYSEGVEKTLSAETSNVISFGISHMTYSRDWRNGRAWRKSGGGGFGGRRHHVRSNGRMF